MEPRNQEETRWLAENKEAILSINSFLKDHGLLANKLRYRREDRAPQGKSDSLK
jgi:post-segregation antitoxin (ccd killing protein)